MRLKSRACPVCGSANSAKIFMDADFDPDQLDSFAFASRKNPEFMHFRLLLCHECDVLYSSPAIEFEKLEKAYAIAAYDSAEEAYDAADTYAKYLNSFKLTLRDCALDIGTGNGAFLEKLIKANFKEVIGIEPSLAPIETASLAIRSLIKHDSFNFYDYKKESFSLVTCFQTLEHIYRPDIMCRQIYDLLQPKGAAFFITHNYRSLLSRLLGKKSPIYDIEHMQLFSKKSLRLLMEQAGFRSISVQNITNTYSLLYWIRLLPVRINIKNKLLSYLKRSRVGRVRFSVSVGNISAIGYKD